MEKMRLLWNLRRTTRQFGLPELVFCCTLFFLGGVIGSFLFLSTSQHVEDELVKDSVQFLPHGRSGEALPSSVEYQILSWKPRAVYFPNFATSKQCQQIIKKAKVNLHPSGLALRKGESVASTKGVRTSSGTFINALEDPSGALKAIDDKIARVTIIPSENGEAYNVLRYEIGQKYASHLDSFNPNEYGVLKSQGVASFLLYLSDVEEGGETMFPYENESNTNVGYDYEQCIGLKVKPRQGDGLLFYSLFVNGTIDPV